MHSDKQKCSIFEILFQLFILFILLWFQFYFKLSFKFLYKVDQIVEKNCEANYLHSNVKQFKHFASNISNTKHKF